MIIISFIISHNSSIGAVKQVFIHQGHPYHHFECQDNISMVLQQHFFNSTFGAVSKHVSEHLYDVVTSPIL